jgi:hypothetical protein
MYHLVVIPRPMESLAGACERKGVVEASCPEHLPEFEIALNAGSRLSELYDLTWETVDLTRRLLTALRAPGRPEP